MTISDQLTLSWSPPPVSADYTNTSTLVFTYSLTLTSVADPVQSFSFTTDINHYNISEVQLPRDYNVCDSYWWSVGISYNGLTVHEVRNKDSVHIPSGTVYVVGTHYCAKIIYSFLFWKQCLLLWCVLYM